MTTARATGLPPRLEAVARLVPLGARLADIGSDHGLLPRALLRSGRVAFALATEKTAELAARVDSRATASGIARGLAVRAGDGFSALRPEDAIDTVVVAGLGGRAIARILAGALGIDAATRVLVLQPRSKPAELRAFLSTNGWRLEAESLTVERGRRHLTLKASRGGDGGLYRHASLSRADLLEAGPLLVRERPPELAALWVEERDRLAGIHRRGRPDSRSTEAARVALARAERILAALVPGIPTFLRGG
jgi:tRNA (adenine22-N1)-methyltransferase